MIPPSKQEEPRTADQANRPTQVDGRRSDYGHFEAGFDPNCDKIQLKGEFLVGLMDATTGVAAANLNQALNELGGLAKPRQQLRLNQQT